MMIIIKRPDGNKSSASYLYNVILRNKDWEKVTLLVQEDDQMIDRLAKHGITFYKMDGNIQITKEISGQKELLVELVNAIDFFDSILNGILTDQQMAEIMARESELHRAIEAKEKAKEVIGNE